MKLEQVFYGRGPKGYAILGSSLPDCGLTDCVRDLCGAVGTPGVERPGEESPFLLQRRAGNSLVMICGRKGEPDSLGRGTLLFHALIADWREARNSKVSALALYNEGVFAATPVLGRLEGLTWSGEGNECGDKCFMTLPAAIKCRRTENLKALARLGDKLNEVNWVSFSWKPLRDFDYQALDVSCSVGIFPGNINVYDINGSLLRCAGPVKTESAEKSMTETVNEQNQIGMALGRKIVVAAFLLGLGFVLGKITPVMSENDPSAVQVQTANEQPRAIFDDRYRITDFNEGIKKICLPRDRSSDFVLKLKEYVDFVNREYKTTTNQKGEK